jgi:hypothetical protein
MEHGAQFSTYLGSKNLNPLAYACKDVEELVSEHLSDCITVSKETGLLTVTLDKDIALEKIFDLVEVEREARETRVGAGDELSELRFSAKNPPRLQTQHYQNKGKGYGKGQKRQGGPLNAQAQRPRFN